MTDYTVGLHERLDQSEFCTHFFARQLKEGGDGRLSDLCGIISTLLYSLHVNFIVLFYFVCFSILNQWIKYIYAEYAYRTMKHYTKGLFSKRITYTACAFGVVRVYINQS